MSGLLPLKSIRDRLIAGITCGLIGFNLVAGYAIFMQARSEANELFDYELQTVARSLPLIPQTISMNSSGLTPGHRDISMANHLYGGAAAEPASIEHTAVPAIALGELSDDKLVIQTWHDSDDRDKPSTLAQNTVVLPRYDSGLHTIHFGGQSWRVFSASRQQYHVQISQPLTVRDELALKLALRILLPMWLLFPVLLLLIIWAINQGIKPVRHLSHTLGTRSPSLLEPLPSDSLPGELIPLVAALNQLLGQLEHARQAQRNFVADAAHELRTPLTALKLHIESAIADGTLQGSPEVVHQLGERLDRMTRVAVQLLTLAREEAHHRPVQGQADLKKIAQSVVGDMSLLAERKNIDLGLDIETDTSNHPDQPIFVLGQQDSLKTLLMNLLDNAIRHTPEGGKIDVRLILDRQRAPDNPLTLVVQDTGPGVDDNDIKKLTQRFYRADDHFETGSGLGLAIVAQIVQRHQLQLAIANRTDGSGLRFSFQDFKVLG